MANAVSNSPVDRWESITPSDTVDIDPPNPRYISVNGAGNLALVAKDGNGEKTAVVMTVAVGVLYELNPLRINSTSTTATGIVAHYGG